MISNKMLINAFRDFLLKRPNPKEIIWANFAVTYKCNSRCTMCSIWKKYKDKAHLVNNELTIDDYEKLLKSNYLRNLHGIGLTGGEPFLRGDIVDLAGMFIEKYPDALVGIATNGLNTDLVFSKTKQILEEFDPRNLSVSLSCDGIGQDHDKVRGIKNAYNNLINTVNRLKSLEFNIGLIFTITPQNYKCICDVYRLCKDKNIKFFSTFAHNSRVYYDNTATSFDWSESQLNEIEHYIKMIVADMINNESFLNKLVNPYPYYMLNCASYQKEESKMINCFSGTHSLFMDPYGDVYPCLILDKKLGNIKDEKFDELWLSAEAEGIRDHIRSGNCSCWISCEVIPSLMRSPSIIKWNIDNKVLRR